MIRVIFLFIVLCSSCLGNTERKVLNIFIWYNSIPAQLLKKFEQETGIKVNVDFYDNNNVLEAKLISGNTGYDIVSPTAWPFVARQVSIGVYQKINKAWLSNYNNIDRTLLRKMLGADPGNNYIVPYFWGLVAIGYNANRIKEIVPKEHLNSWALLYNKDLVKKTTHLKRAVLDDSMDVLLSCFIYNRLRFSQESLDMVRANLKGVRPYIKKFANSLTPNQLVSGELDIIMHWSEFILEAKRNLASNVESANIKIILPKEGTLMWIDGLAIPVGAKNVANAYKFINFLLRPESAAYITNNIGTAIAVSNRSLIKKEIRENKVIFPDKEYMQKVFLPEIKSLSFQRKISRCFTAIVANRGS